MNHDISNQNISDLDKTWPFYERRHPSKSNPDYLGSKGLTTFLKKIIKIEIINRGLKNLNVLDVGCGEKPFYPYFHDFTKNYIGTEIIENEYVDVICPAEDLLIEDNWADVVMCLSVMEHVNDPDKVISELFRVTKKGGLLLLSTHGFFPWHPYPQDHWRWTQTGLKLIIEKGGFDSVEIHATRGTISGIFFLLAHYTNTWAQKNKTRKFFGKFFVATINRLGEHFDKRNPSLADINRHVTAIPEFFCVIKK
jgi:SAM-dependent methyltransferase